MLAKLGSPFLVLNFGFHIVDSVGRLDLEGNSLPCECLDEYLHLCSVDDTKRRARVGKSQRLRLKVWPVQF